MRATDKKLTKPVAPQARALIFLANSFSSDEKETSWKTSQMSLMVLGKFDRNKSILFSLFNAEL